MKTFTKLELVAVQECVVFRQDILIQEMASDAFESFPKEKKEEFRLYTKALGDIVDKITGFDDG